MQELLIIEPYLKKGTLKYFKVRMNFMVLGLCKVALSFGGRVWEGVGVVGCPRCLGGRNARAAQA